MAPRLWLDIDRPRPDKGFERPHIRETERLWIGGFLEGGVDLVKLAGLGEAAVLSELTNADGTMAKLPEILSFAEKHHMTVVTIEDIYAYKQMQEKHILNKEGIHSPI